MKKLIIILLVIIYSNSSFGQRGNISNNFFGHLEFTSLDGRYTATLEKDFFEGLEFSDNAKNKVTFDNKYLSRHFSGILTDNKRKTEFLRNMVRKYSRETGYEASYSIDILGKEIIEDNRGYSSESGTDIFGHEYFEESDSGSTVSIRRNINGGLEYKRNKFTANLEKDIFGKWIYDDNESNKIEFNQNAWNKLIKRFGSEREVFHFLIRQLTGYNEAEYGEYDLR